MTEKTINKGKSVKISDIKANGHKLTAKDAMAATEEPKHEIVPVVESKVEVPADFKSKLTKNQIELVKRTIAKGASDDELKMFLYVCQRTGLDPFTKQIHLVPRWDSRANGGRGGEVRTPITGIDGLRSIAERTGVYAGNDDPTFDDESKPNKATVTVYKVVQGQRYGFTATARWSQYFPGEKQGFMWNKMPHLMLGKCAEALALRKAFPTVMSGLYVAEEIGQVVEAKPEPTAYETAKKLIGTQTNEAVLHDYKKKITGSAKYSDEEKKDLQMAIDDRITKLEKEKNAQPVNKTKAETTEARG